MGMKVLIDTHVFLWAVLEPERLSRTVKKILEDLQTEVFLSAACVWEIATKHRLGKLRQADYLVKNFEQALSSLQIEELPIVRAHALKAGSWPVEHRDPFDRILAAQALLEGIPLLTIDPAFEAFSIEVIW
jgi:PIN domain nuclease of toxin-antitoxin system